MYRSFVIASNATTPLAPSPMPEEEYQKMSVSALRKQFDSTSNQESGGSKKQPNGVPVLQSKDSQLPEDKINPDVMISYSHSDREIMLALKKSLEEYGYTVWVDKVGLGSGDNFLEKIGQAIIDSKIFIAIVSENQIGSKYCVGEVALAYISDKPIFPVALEDKRSLLSKMPTGMRLELAEFEWIDFHKDAQVNEETFTKGFHELEKKITLELKKDKYKGLLDSRSLMTGFHTQLSTTVRSEKKVEEEVSNEPDFWEVNFGDNSMIPWNEFQDAFRKSMPKDLYSEIDIEDILKLLQKEFRVTKNVLKLESYKIFVTSLEGKSIPFFKRVNQYSVETLAVNEVFAVESRLRFDAINNLAKYKSYAVMEGLLDMLDSDDPNIKAVAAMTLAKTGHRSQDVEERIYRCLSDEDRLVRESACLAMGRLKINSDKVVKKIVSIWRNDVIASVRDCAELALEQLDSEDARTAIHMTQLLKKEIQLLKD